MKVLKFGGTSVGSVETLSAACSIVRKQSEKDQLIVVVSAFSGVTNTLESLALLALQGADVEADLQTLTSRHTEMVQQLVSSSGEIDHLESLISEYVEELRGICTGVQLVGELSPKSRARLMSAGELMSSYIVKAVLEDMGVDVRRVDMRDVIRTTGDPLNGTVVIDETYENALALAQNPTSVTVVPGFIARDTEGNTSTLGRGGSDYTASLLAAALSADTLEIWTDVSGVMTANPRLVSRAHSVPQMTYAEAMELSYFGAKVIYAPTIHPLIKGAIPLHIKNTLEPDAPGTVISNADDNGEHPVKGISSIFDVSLITVSGSGMVGVPGTAMRMFRALAQNALNILFITQSSSEQTITVGLRTEDADFAARALNAEFELDLEREIIDEINVESDLALVAVVGDQMRSRPGIAGKLFGLLGDNGINVRAIAQGSTERNVSLVVHSSDARKALNTLHEGFFLSETRSIHLFNIGVGNVGATVLNQIKDQHAALLEQFGVDLKVVGLANSRQMLFDPDGIDLATWKEQMTSGEAFSFDGFIGTIDDLNLRNSIFMDNTGSADVAGLYERLLSMSVNVVTSNKIAASSDFDNYLRLKSVSAERNVQYLFETNVAAGLPVIKTIRDMKLTGDKIHRIEAVLSGSLNYIFNHISAECSFSSAVAQARELGLTEPDPAIDLSGLDVQRKILILAREAGYEMELSGVGRGHMIPAELQMGMDWEALQAYLQQHDAGIERGRAAVEGEGRQWRFMATLIDGIASVGVLSIGPEHPAWVLHGKDNLVLIYSDRYPEQPLVIKGAGAGPDVTASGVLADILRIANV